LFARRRAALRRQLRRWELPGALLALRQEKTATLAAIRERRALESAGRRLMRQNEARPPPMPPPG